MYVNIAYRSWLQQRTKPYDATRPNGWHKKRFPKAETPC